MFEIVRQIYLGVSVNRGWKVSQETLDAGETRKQLTVRRSSRKSVVAGAKVSPRQGRNQVRRATLKHQWVDDADRLWRCGQAQHSSGR